VFSCPCFAVFVEQLFPEDQKHLFLKLLLQKISIYFFLNFIDVVLPKFTSLILVSSGIIPNRLATS
jgi:hypothetical protein